MGAHIPVRSASFHFLAYIYKYKYTFSNMEKEAGEESRATLAEYACLRVYLYLNLNGNEDTMAGYA